MKKLFLLLFPLFIQAQDVAIGFWKDYQSYNSASYIAEAKNKIYCVTSGCLFYLDKSDNTINRMSKVTGLSDVGVKQVAYSETLNITMITYENCNIDLLKNNQIINISDIKRKEITGLKLINNITLREGIAYLSCSFGLVVVDLEKEEIKDTYKIGVNGNFVEINGCAYNNSTIYVATSGGLFFADINSPSLFDYNSWTRDSLWEGVFHNIHVIGNTQLWGGDTLSSYTNETLIYIDSDTLLILDSINNYQFEKLYHSSIVEPSYAIKDMDGVIWIADLQNGLLKFVNYEYQESFIPEGPKRNDIYSLEYLENTLYMCHGGHANFSTNALINDGVSIKSDFDEWANYDRYKLGNARDILEVAVNNGAEYYASWYHGIPEMKDGELIIKYGFDNTGGVLDTVWYSNNRIRISDLKFDASGNLWGLSSEVNHPLFVKTHDGSWYSFNMNQPIVGLFFDDLLIDSWGQKWGVIGAHGSREGGVFVYNDNNTISNPSDDQFNILSTNLGDGNLPSQVVYSITEDLENTIWIGTDKGVAVFYNPSSIFSGYDFDAQQILIQEGEYGQYLLSEERVKCITIDGANRKWIGTEKSGVFLLSEDGTNQIFHFTAENSPLFSNNIIDIAINPENGEVFIGTGKGLISYRSDATEGKTIQSTTNVFPNPVRETYFGPIAINGLVTNANIKITDVDGNLVFEDYAKGGQAIWNGKNKNNERASSGVYLVFSIDENGTEKMVSKILFIK
ncbi:hypothetical protein OAJ65_00450 [Flavobacteriales bacterium]|nr:hypothetical protein [Flavobacteriales bacterium]